MRLAQRPRCVSQQPAHSNRLVSSTRRGRGVSTCGNGLRRDGPGLFFRGIGTYHSCVNSRAAFAARHGERSEGA